MDNQITINENSVITLKEASEMLDELFKCGIKTETTATCWVTEKEIMATYFDCSLVEEAEHLKNVFKGTAYNPANGGQDIFEKDFVKWVRLGQEINLFKQKRKGDYMPSDVEAFLNKQNERNELWEKIKTVFYKEQLPNKQNPQKGIALTEQQTNTFNKAIEAGLMAKKDERYIWKHDNGKKASLAYFLEKTFAPNKTEQIPYKKLEPLFNVSRLDSALYGVYNAIKPQKWRAEIDKIF